MKIADSTDSEAKSPYVWLSTYGRHLTVPRKERSRFRTNRSILSRERVLPPSRSLASSFRFVEVPLRLIGLLKTTEGKNRLQGSCAWTQGLSCFALYLCLPALAQRIVTVVHRLQSGASLVTVIFAVTRSLRVAFSVASVFYFARFQVPMKELTTDLCREYPAYGSDISRSLTWRCLCLCVLTVIYGLATVASDVVIAYQMPLQTYCDRYLFGLGVDHMSPANRTLLRVVVIVLSLSYGLAVSFAIVFIQYIIGTNYLLRTVVRQFERNVTAICCRRTLGAKDVLEVRRSFVRTSVLVRRVDGLLSLVILLWMADIVATNIVLLPSLIRQILIDGTTPGPRLVLLVVNFVCCVLLCVSASDLDRDFPKWLCSIQKSKHWYEQCDPDFVYESIFLVEALRSINLTISAGSFVVLSKGTMLSIFSGVASYALLVLQYMNA